LSEERWRIRRAGPILKRYLALEPITRPSFDVLSDAPPEAFQAEVAEHPVFKLTPTGSLRT